MAIALYARQSVERENSISCETQLEYCKATIKPDEQAEELLIFIDNGCSGGNTNRDGFQKLMRQVEQRRIRKVIVYKLDRISRSLGDFVGILQTFKASGVEFVSSQESFDTSSPYGELIVKILMVFAEFERTSIINRITQAYSHRSEMGFYMGGRRPYGFELAPATINGVVTKKLKPIPAEIEQLQYIFEAYANEAISLGRLCGELTEGVWTASKLSAILKNPIYVKADFDVYDYFERRGAEMITDVSLFTGEYGAQLYGRTKHDSALGDWSDMKLVLLSHGGVISSDIWLKCQGRLEQNRRTGNSMSNRTSWLSGKLLCEKCGCTMTTVKGKPDKHGKIRRYFNCTGKSHKRICTGTSASVYAEELENVIYDCIAEKLSSLKGIGRSPHPGDFAAVNELKLKIRELEKSESRLTDSITAGGLNNDALALINKKASLIKKDKASLAGRIEKLSLEKRETCNTVDLAQLWKDADYSKKKEIASIIIHRILIRENGDTVVIWNL